MDWVLTYDGTTQTFAEWGLGGLSFQSQNFGVGSSHLRHCVGRRCRDHHRHRSNRLDHRRHRSKSHSNRNTPMNLVRDTISRLLQSIACLWLAAGFSIPLRSSVVVINSYRFVSAAAPDPYYSSVVLLLPCDGTDGGITFTGRSSQPYPRNDDDTV